MVARNRKWWRESENSGETGRVVEEQRGRMAERHREQGRGDCWRQTERAFERENGRETQRIREGRILERDRIPERERETLSGRESTVAERVQWRETKKTGERLEMRMQMGEKIRG